MFKKYEKIPASLHFTLHTVNLKRKINSDFKLSFQRGNSYHGATDLVHPDDKGILKFEASYDTKCTLYLSKQDATTKPKKLKIILHRFTDPNTSKIYGKLVIDVSKYYGSKSVSYEEMEMESGRSIPPVLGISIIIKQAGQSVVGAIDQSDKSFIDEDTERIPVNDWDKTEIDNKDLIQRHTDRKSKKDRKRKTKADSDDDQSEKLEKSDNTDISDKSESEKEEEKPKKKKNKKKKAEQKPESETAEKDEKAEPKEKKTNKVSTAAHDTDDNEDKKEAHPVITTASVPDLSSSDEEKEKEESNEKGGKKKKKKSHKKSTKHESESDKSEKDEKQPPASDEEKEAKTKEVKVKEEKEKEEKEKKQPLPPIPPKDEKDKSSGAEDNKDAAEKKPKKAKKSSEKPAEPAEKPAEPSEKPAESKEGDDADSKVKVRSTSSTPVVVETIKEVKKKNDLDIEQMITSVIARSWSNAGRPVYLDAKRRIQIPAAVFSIYAVLLHTKVFQTVHVENKDFSNAMDTFFDEYENAPICDNCTSDQRFITTLCLILLINRYANDNGFAPERVKKFTSRLLPFMNDYARQVVAPLLINFEVLCNRFATARFEVDPLLEDFREVLDGIKSSLMYTQGINNYLLKHFMQLLDVKMLNKLLANPARFVFSKAVTWNSFLSAFLAAEKFELPLLRQAVYTLVMAVNMTSDDQPSEEVRTTLCPTLDPKIIVYLLKNYKPDEMIPTAINWKKVAEAVHVDDVATYDPVRPTDIDDYTLPGEKLKIQVWNQVQIDQSVLKLYPYLSAYSVASH